MAADATGATHILVVDDDARIRQMLARYFEEEGYLVTGAGDGSAMRQEMKAQAFDIILLDLSLPGGQDGLDLAREVRAQSDIPIVMLTGRDDVVDRIVGLEIGADDYIAKPFHLREVLARVKSILRRRQPAQPRSEAAATETLVHFDGWTMKPERRELLSPDGSAVDLTTGEFDMLNAFVQHAGRVLSREFLMDLTRGRQREAFDRTIDAQIVRLRRKIETDAKRPQLIKAVRGVGYVFTGRVR